MKAAITWFPRFSYLQFALRERGLDSATIRAIIPIVQQVPIGQKRGHEAKLWFNFRHGLVVYPDTTYDRRMDKPKPRMPVLATACCALFSILAWVALLTHHPFLTFYCGFGFLAVVLIVWFRNRRNPAVPYGNPVVTDLERAPRESPDVREKRNE